jgi:hypothetical protein
VRSALSIAGAGAALAALGYAFVMTASAMSCERRAPAVVAAVATVDAAPVVVAEKSARWESTGDADKFKPWAWRRTEGEHAPPLVVRGVIEPKDPDDLAFSCPEVMGGRRGWGTVYLATTGSPRDIHVFARARGPIGIRSRDGCAVARSNEWVHLEIAAVGAEEIQVELMDIDSKGERRGQTSPFVMVVRDEDALPNEDPAERKPLAENDVAVRWSMTPAPCGQGMEFWQCAHVALELSGAETRTIRMKQMLTGQSGCWPSGTGIRCSGASGASDLSVKKADDGTVRVSTYAVSDGYCPDGEECGATTMWATFRVKPTSRLVPDPTGTLPPLTEP